MLFDTRFREGVRSGAVILTFRAWKRPQAKPGGAYRLWGDTRIAVTGVDMVPLADVSDGEAGDAGFANAAELRAYIDSGPAGPLADDAEVYRVAFHFVGDVAEQPVTASDEHVETALRDLAAIDRRSARGAWTLDTLRLVEQMPRTRAGTLADAAGRERLKFKADVRRLKYMGLTRSLEVGYELTELGERVLERLR